MESFSHQSVLVKEVLEAFSPLVLNCVVDGTLGAGGHACGLLEHHPEISTYLGIDQDPMALDVARRRLQPWGGKVIYKHGNFDDFDAFMSESSLKAPNGILVDLGVSSMQLNDPDRGFSFMQEGPLDMRMNPELELTATEIVNTWSESDLGRIFRDYGEEKQWKRAAREIVRARALRPFQTTADLKNVLTPVLERYAKKKGIHPVTLVFQALRICVNRELAVLDSFLPRAIDYLAPGGRLVVISFHSLEDRIVKNHMRFAASDKWETVGLGGLFRDKEPLVKLITKKPIEPSEEEIKGNPRSRSAKLRVVEKLHPRGG